MPPRTEPGAGHPAESEGARAAASVDWTRFEAVLFDLDGVLTATARLHAAAWTRLFDGYLAERAAAESAPFRPFEPGDYARYVDGRPRYDGVRAFLASRGITLPDGAPDDPPGDGTVCGLGNRKQAFFHDLLASEGADIIPGTVAVVRHLRRRGVRTAVVSSSRNCAAILESAGLASLFELQVDGVVAAELDLAGKPTPDTFLHAARTMGVAPARAAVVEDAIAGVAAGRAGGFGLVVGIDRADVPDELARAGADLVVSDLADTLPGRDPDKRRPRSRPHTDEPSPVPCLKRGHPHAAGSDPDGRRARDRPHAGGRGPNGHRAGNRRHVARRGTGR